MIWRAAITLFPYGIDHVCATRRTIRLVFNVCIRTEEFILWRRGRGRFILGQRPTQLGRINVLPVQTPSSFACLFDGLGNVWNGDRRQQSDDRHDHHDFDKREA